jgi:hypothetical protein
VKFKSAGGLLEERKFSIILPLVTGGGLEEMKDMCNASVSRAVPVWLMLLTTLLLLTSCADVERKEDNFPAATLQTTASIPAVTPEPVPVVEAARNEAEAAETLLSSVPDKGIYLHSKEPEGVVLTVGASRQEYDWMYMTPRGIEPILLVYDYDSDGKEELSIDLYIGSGTGYAVEELHIVEMYGDPAPSATGEQSAVSQAGLLKDHRFSPDEYLLQLREAVSFKVTAKDGALFGE